MVRHDRSALALCLVALCACLGSGGSGDPVDPPPPPPPPPAPPTGLTLVPGSWWGHFDVAWSPPAAGTYDAWEFEAADDDGPFEAIESTIPTWETSGYLDAQGTAEAAWIHLRLRARRGTLASEWSNVASAQQRLRDPTWIHVTPTYAPPGTTAVRAPVLVSWDCPSGIGPDVVLERAEQPTWPNVPLWQVLVTLPGCPTSYADAAVVDGGSYLYRVTFSAGGLLSRTVTSNASIPLDVLAPGDVAVSLIVPDGGGDPTGFRVSWTSLSATADRVTVANDGWDLGTVAASAGAFDDLVWPQWPGGKYRVRAWRDGYSAGAGVSPWVAAPGFTLTGAISLASGTVAVPAGGRYARDPDGGVHVFENRWSSGIVMYRPTAGGWDEHATTGDAWPIDPVLDVDPDGHPHAMFVLVRPCCVETPAVVRHVWHDGTSWQEEDLTLEPSASDFAFAAGPGGAVDLVYCRVSNGTVETVDAAKSGGAWSSSVLPTPAVLQSHSRLDAGPDGTVFLLVGDGSGGDPLLLVRPPGGSWTVETVSGAGAIAPDAYYDPGAWIAAGSDGNAALFFERFDWQADRQEFWYVRRDGTGTKPPALIASGPNDHLAARAASAAVAPDGSRTLFLVDLTDASSARHSELFVRGASGGFRRMRIGPWGRPQLSLDAAGKAAVLVTGSGSTGTTIELPTLVEP